MIKPLTLDLALPLYAELPNYESKAPEIESDFDSQVVAEAYGGLERSLQRDLAFGDESPLLFVRG
jgi:hypothetical protein